IDQIAENRAGLNYEIDGMVLKIADRDAYEAAGSTSHHPRGAMAFKLAAEVGETHLNAVTWQCGRTGTLSPVAEIQPVFLAGTTSRRATLHNMDIVAQRDIKIGDKIKIKRAGDVIPFVIGPVVEARDGSEQEIVPPTNCPSCGTPVEMKQSGKARVVTCP